jgi:predicted DNA-binding protein
MAKTNLTRQIAVRLDPERFEQLDAFARREGFSVSLVVRHLVCRFLEDQRRNSGKGAL